MPTRTAKSTVSREASRQVPSRVKVDREVMEEIEFIDHPCFHQPDAMQQLFDHAPPLPVANSDWYPSSVNGAWDADQPARTKPLLTPPQERALFLQYNYARFRWSAAATALALNKDDQRQASNVMHWRQMSLRLRDQIVEFNLSLVLAMIRHVAASKLDFGDLLSEGNLTLLRAVEKFDVKRNFKFSTYACRAILKCFSRMSVKRARRAAVVMGGFSEEVTRNVRARDEAADDLGEYLVELRDLVRSNAVDLTPLERKVFDTRFPLQGDCDDPPTLQEIGRMVGYSKERVRQIEKQALQKIRLCLEERLGTSPF